MMQSPGSRCHVPYKESRRDDRILAGEIEITYVAVLTACSISRRAG